MTDQTQNNNLNNNLTRPNNVEKYDTSLINTIKDSFFGYGINGRYTLAMELDKEGHSEAALYILEQLVKKYPNCKPCRYNMGRIAKSLYLKSNNPNSNEMNEI